MCFAALYSFYEPTDVRWNGKLMMGYKVRSIETLSLLFFQSQAMLHRFHFLLALSSAYFVGNTQAVGTPFGLATGTTGGGSATAAIPSSLAELTTWLSDSTPRVILLDKMFDFTSAEGTVTGPACKPWTCSPNPQVGFVIMDPIAIANSHNDAFFLKLAIDANSCKLIAFIPQPEEAFLTYNISVSVLQGAKIMNHQPLRRQLPTTRLEQHP